MRTAIVLALLVLSGSGGDLSLAHAMKRVGEIQGFSPSVILRFLARAFGEAWMWIGVAQLTLAFCSLLALLSWESVSFVPPATALSYVTGAVGGKMFLG